jgi:hypothetical protein
MKQVNQDGTTPVVTGVKDIYKDFKNVLDVVSRGLWAGIKNAKGSCVSFTTRKVLKYAECDFLATPVILTLVRHVLIQLKEKGYLWIDESRGIRKYIVCKDSTLWHMAKNGDGPEDVFMFLQKEVE